MKRLQQFALGFVTACALAADAHGDGFTATGSLGANRYNHTATRLLDGRVLVVGGYGYDDSGPGVSAELYNPATGTWTNTSSLNEPREFHTATLLPNGKVLVAGGVKFTAYGPFVVPSRLYNPTNDTWSYAGVSDGGRYYHTATLLANGKVLIVGGIVMTSFGLLLGKSAVLYNPVTDTSVFTGSLSTERTYHTATVLPNGKVLVAGGWGTNGALTSAELYNPATGTWTNTGSLDPAFYVDTLTLLPNGKVLAVGGTNAELYDPATGVWSFTGSPAHGGSTATLLPNGKVLVAGGLGYSPALTSQYLTGVLSSAELYEPAPSFLNPIVRPIKPGGGSCQFFFSGKPGGTNYHVLASTAAAAPINSWLDLGLPSETPAGSGHFQFTDTQAPSSSLRFYRLSLAVAAPGANEFNSTGSLLTGRAYQTATLLPNGKVLVVGGTSAELYDPATGTWSPAGNPGTSGTATLLLNGKVLVAGVGAALYESFLNPITNPFKLSDGSFRFGFSNPSGTNYHVLASPDPAAPLNTWSNLGPATETPPGSGQYQFTDHQATNYPRRSYRVSSP